MQDIIQLIDKSIEENKRFIKKHWSWQRRDKCNIKIWWESYEINSIDDLSILRHIKSVLNSLDDEDNEYCLRKISEWKEIVDNRIMYLRTKEMKRDLQILESMRKCYPPSVEEILDSLKK